MFPITPDYYSRSSKKKKKKKNQSVPVVQVNKIRTIRQCLCNFFWGSKVYCGLCKRGVGPWTEWLLAPGTRAMCTPLGRGCERRLRTTQTLDGHISIGFCWFLCVWTCDRTVAEVNEWERGLEPTKTELSINHFSVNAFSSSVPSLVILDWSNFSCRHEK